MTESSDREGTSADHDSRVHVRREADERFVAAIRVGDTETFGRLLDNWIDTVHDRLSRAGIPDDRASHIEQAAFEASWRDASSGGGASTFGATIVRHTIREAKDDHSPPTDTTGAHTRVLRATNLGSVAADPGVATMMFEAAEALGLASSTIFDLRFRHGFTFEEIGEAIGREPAEVERLSERLPDAFDAVVRARVIWGEGLPALWGGSEDEVAPVRDALDAAGVSTFGADAVRVLNKLVREDDRLRARAMIPLGASTIFAAIPLAAATPEHKRSVAAALADRGVPVGRSEFASRVRRPSAAAASAAAAAVARERDEAAAEAARRGIPTTDDPSAAPLESKAARAAAAGAAGVAGAKAVAKPGDKGSDAGPYGRKTEAAAASAGAAAASTGKAGTAGGAGSDGDGSGSSRKPLLVGAAVLVTILLVGGIAMALGGGDGEDGDDVALGSEPEVTTTTSTTRRTTSTTARSTSTTAEDPGDEGETDETVVDEPTVPTTRPEPSGPDDPEVIPPPVVTTQTTLPAGQIPTTVPREQSGVRFKVVGRAGDTSTVKSPYSPGATSVYASWESFGRAANVTIEETTIDGSRISVIGTGPEGEMDICPGGWPDPPICTPEPGRTYYFTAFYTVDGVRLKAATVPISFSG